MRLRRLPHLIAALTLLAGCQSSVSLDGLQFGPADVVQDVTSSPDVLGTGDSGDDAWWRGNFDATLYCDNGICGGACTNGTDQPMAADQLAVKTKLMTAMQTCLGGGDYSSACVSSAMTNGNTPFFSGVCSDCFGAYYTCGLSHCVSQCISGTTAPPCAGCFQTQCSPGFAECSGWLVSW